jgi:hypothetical protein
MDVSQSVTPAELEPDPDSPVSSRFVRRPAGAAYHATLIKENGSNRSNTARNRDEYGPNFWLVFSGRGYPEIGFLRRDLLSSAP